MGFGYSFLRGRQGAEGHVQEKGVGRLVTLRGLKEGEACVLYVFSGGAARTAARERADGAGQARLTANQKGKLFVAVGGQVRLWEGEEEDYLRACAWLAEEKKNALAEEKEKEKEKGAEEAAPSLPAPSREEPEDPGRAPAPEKQKAPLPPPEREYTLRPAGEGEGVDALPELVWPASVRELRFYFASLPPVHPFHAPGWRFVRTLGTGKRNCVVGFLARDSRVAEIAYGVEGGGPVPGFRFQQGLDGRDYWVMKRDC